MRKGRQAQDNYSGTLGRVVASGFSIDHHGPGGELTSTQGGNFMATIRLISWCASLGVVICSALVSGYADVTWNWNYSGSGIAAAGTLTTTDTPDASGFYQVLSISGLRNEVEITGLYPTGQAIPGNEPFTVDNLLKQGSDGQMTVHGLGYTLASGAYSNPFFTDFVTPPGYLEVFTQGSFYRELPVQFYATPVPEAGSAAFAITGLTIMALCRNLRSRRASA